MKSAAYTKATGMTTSDTEKATNGFQMETSIWANFLMAKSPVRDYILGLMEIHTMGSG